MMLNELKFKGTELHAQKHRSTEAEQGLVGESDWCLQGMAGILRQDGVYWCHTVKNNIIIKGLYGVNVPVDRPPARINQKSLI